MLNYSNFASFLWRLKNESQSGHFFHFPLLQGGGGVGGHLGTTLYKKNWAYMQPQKHTEKLVYIISLHSNCCTQQIKQTTTLSTLLTFIPT